MDTLSVIGSTTLCKSFEGKLGPFTDFAPFSAYEIVLGIILGALTGYIARKIMQFSESRKLIDRQSYVAQYISLAVFTIGE
jgi:NhaP-type Na+/H+ or K+/H+ antiporter